MPENHCEILIAGLTWGARCQNLRCAPPDRLKRKVCDSDGGQAGTSPSGSFAELRLSAAGRLKPQIGFRDRAEVTGVTARGWIGEWRLMQDFSDEQPLARMKSAQRRHAVVPRYLRHAHADEEGVFRKGVTVLQEALQQRVRYYLLVLQ